MRDWSARRRALWRWGWVTLAVGVLCCPIGTIGTCTHGDTGGECTSQSASLVGLMVGIGY